MTRWIAYPLGASLIAGLLVMMDVALRYPGVLAIGIIILAIVLVGEAFHVFFHP